MNANNYTSYNTTAALSRTKDLDMGKAMTEQKKAQVLQQYQMQMQRRRTENEQNQTARLLGING